MTPKWSDKLQVRGQTGLFSVSAEESNSPVWIEISHIRLNEIPFKGLFSLSLCVHRSMSNGAYSACMHIYILYKYTQMEAQGHHAVFLAIWLAFLHLLIKHGLRFMALCQALQKMQPVLVMFCIPNSSDHQDRSTARSCAPGSLKSHRAKTRFQEVREMFSKLAVNQIFHLSA